ncbi:ABC transporter permease, partial [Bosea thiooxidans]
MIRAVSGLRMILAAFALAAFAFFLIGPLVNLALWSVAERWYTPYKLPVVYGTRYWEQVFRPTGDAMASLGTSVWIAVLTVIVALALSIPAGYALARLKLPVRAFFMVLFLLPQAFPSVAIYINVARVFYNIGINGTVFAVVLVHAAHGLVYSVWIAAAAFAAVDRDLELAARNIGASPLRTFFSVTLPLAAPG